MDRLMIPGILAALVLTSAGCAGSRVVAETAGSADTNVIVENQLLWTMEKARIPGLAALTMKDGEVVGEYYLGYADLEEGRPVDADTRFMIASMSKPVTAAALMLLVQRGELDLDADINRYLPFEVRNPAYPAKPITARMLLAHTSSIRDDWDVLDPLYTLESGGGDSKVSLMELSTAYLVSGGRWYDPATSYYSGLSPGESRRYCNIGYALLGLIIEEIDGRSYDVFSREEILDPLGMESASWLLKNTDAARTAMPYEVNRRGVRALGHYGYPDYPDGQLRTTIRDYARFLEVFLDPQNGLLDPPVRTEFLTIQFPDADPHQAVAWHYDEFESAFVRNIIGYLPAHTGGDPGVITYGVMDPDSGSAVLLFLNGSRTNFGSVKSVYVDTLDALCFEAGIGRYGDGFTGG